MTPSPSGALAGITIATRGSRLALAQTEIVSHLLQELHPSLAIDISIVRTTGDVDQRPFAEIGGKGLFTTEVERELIEGHADIAIHSAKDLTAEIASGCEIACVPQRGPAHDVVVGGEGATGEERLASLPPSAKVGTSSLRRRALLGEWRPDLDAVEFRGNVDTRLKKVADGVVDVAILAAAGIERLGLTEGSGAVALENDRWVPAPAQGALAIECLSERRDLIAMLVPLEHEGTRAEVDCERAFARVMEGGCSVPLGCRARADKGRLVVDGFLGMPDGSHAMRDRISGGVDEAAALGAELAEAILSCGGREILEELEYLDAPPVPEP